MKISKIEFIADACAKFEKHPISVDRKRCIRLRHQQSTCMRCFAACSNAAVTPSRGFSFDVAMCSGCGACVSVCPTGVFSAKFPSNEDIIPLVKLHVSQSGSVAFACEKYLVVHPADVRRVVAVPCIARIDESVLVGAIMCGASSVIIIDTPCGTCPQYDTSRRILSAFDLVNRLLENRCHPFTTMLTEAIPDQIKPLPPSKKEAVAISRRSFLTAFKKSGADFAALLLTESLSLTPDNVSKSDHSQPRAMTPPKSLPEKWTILRKELMQIKGVREHWVFDGPLWGDVAVASGCNGCGACADFCPTGAIKASENDGRWSLSFDGLLCTQCGLCKEICLTGSIELTSTVELAALITGSSRVLIVKAVGEFQSLSESVEQRMARILGCKVTT